MLEKVVFLDRDGVINIDTGYPYQIREFKFMEGIFCSCKHFLELNFKIIIVTNQSGIARGIFSIEEFIKLNQWMLKKFSDNGVEILDVFFCPHSPDDNCKCRKPREGLFLQAFEKYNINKDESWMIGDSERDITAANLAGINKTILLKSHIYNNYENSNANFVIDSIDDANKLIT